MRRRDIKIDTRPTADRYAARGERIVEFTTPNGSGLISIRLTEHGVDVEVHHTDPTVRVVPPGQRHLQAALAEWSAA